MAQNVTTAQVQSAHGAQTTQTAASQELAARVTVPWWRLSGPFRDVK